MSRKKLVAEQKRLELIEIIEKYVKKEDRVVLTPSQIKATENFAGGPSQVVCNYEVNGKKKKLETSEAGVVGSVFDALIERHSLDYKSLVELKFVGYSVYPVFKEKTKGTNSDAKAEVLLEVSSSNKRPVQFRTN